MTSARAIVASAGGAVLAVAAAAVLTAGTGRPASQQERGRALIDAHGCGACHVVPGVPGARGLVGPPLVHFRRRVLIAGHLPNTPANLQRWIMNSPALEPGTAMPDLDVTPGDAAAMTAYLYSLR